LLLQEPEIREEAGSLDTSFPVMEEQLSGLRVIHELEIMPSISILFVLEKEPKHLHPLFMMELDSYQEIAAPLLFMMPLHQLEVLLL